VPELLGVPVETVTEIEGGWDHAVFEVHGEWIVRVPRRKEVRPWLRKETRLLPEIAPLLPLPVPSFEVAEDGDEPFVAYRKLPGRPIDETLRDGADPAAMGTLLGTFLAALHRVSKGDAEAWTRTDEGEWTQAHRRFREECERRAYPLLDPEEERRLATCFDRLDRTSDIGLVHGDLGPDHILVESGRIVGVIDWTDACIGDAAIDLAWPLHATRPAFAHAVLAAYAPRGDGERVLERSRCYYEVAHLHEVLYGLERSDHALVERALRDVRSILAVRDGGARRLG
jgi:aminoglycoside phosphotransferase (APT) family kinase protein